MRLNQVSPTRNPTYKFLLNYNLCSNESPDPFCRFGYVALGIRLAHAVSSSGWQIWCNIGDSMNVNRV